MQRLAASPARGAQIAQGDRRRSTCASRCRTITRADARDAPPRATLVWDVRHSRYLAENIPGARYVELDGVDSFPFVGDSDAIVEEIEEFLTGGRTRRRASRAPC